MDLETYTNAMSALLERDFDEPGLITKALVHRVDEAILEIVKDGLPFPDDFYVSTWNSYMNLDWDDLRLRTEIVFSEKRGLVFNINFSFTDEDPAFNLPQQKIVGILWDWIKP